MADKNIQRITKPGESDLPDNKAHGEKKKGTSSMIHTMPDYFRNAHLQKKSPQAAKQTPQPPKNQKLEKPTQNQKKSNGPIIILLFVILLVIISVGGFLIYSNFQQNSDAEAQRQAAIEQEKQRQEALEAQRLADQQAQEQQNQQQQEQTEQQEQQERDKSRIQDIHNMQVALEFYFDDQNKYPPFLPDQGSFSQDNKIYLEAIPQNPSPGGELYVYSVNDDGLGYSISFALEVGFGDLPAGQNQASEQRQITTQGTIITRGPRKIDGQDGFGFLMSLDTDLDGVTDIEEAFYGTNKDEFDSDADTYSDKQELINLYNPAGNAPIRLIESGVVKDYENPTFKYSIYYPQTWAVKPLDATNTEVIFTSDTGEFIEVMVQDNSANLSVQDWFTQQNLIETVNILQTVSTREGLQGFRSNDRRTVYYFDKSKVYIVIHNIGNKKEIDYDATFEMMVRSLRVSEEVASEETSSNTNDDRNSDSANAEDQATGEEATNSEATPADSPETNNAESTSASNAENTTETSENKTPPTNEEQSSDSSSTVTDSSESSSEGQ